MANETSAQWEQAILNKMSSNGERLALVENRLGGVENRLNSIENRLTSIETTNQKIESLLGWLKWIGDEVITIALSLVANFVYSLDLLYKLLI